MITMVLPFRKGSITMASTNKTVNYEFGQFVGTDKPAWLTDYNGDMIKIDLAIKTVEDLATNADVKGTVALSSLNVLEEKVGDLEIDLPLKADKVSPIFQGTMILEGGQIKFPLVQIPSSDPNTLDDYEEGTFTPTIRGDVLGGIGTYTEQAGGYVKIGKLVYVNIFITMKNHTVTGGMKIGRAHV